MRAIAWIVEESCGHRWVPVDVFITRASAVNEAKYRESVPLSPAYRVRKYVREEPK